MTPWNISFQLMASGLCTNGATEITGLAAGTHEVRYAAKGGYNAGEAAEVEVPEYEAPIVEAEIETVIAENGKVTITLAAKPTEAPVKVTSMQRQRLMVEKQQVLSCPVLLLMKTA